MRQAIIDRVDHRSMFAPLDRVYRQNVYSARRFIFDDEASRIVGNLMQHHTAMIAGNMEFALQPFPSMYIELNAREVFAGRGGTPVETADTEIGYLAVNGAVFTFAAGPKQSSRFDEVLAAPMSFAINKPQTGSLETVFEAETYEQAKMMKMAYVIGGQRIPKHGPNGEQAFWLPDVGIPNEQLIGAVDIRLLHPVRIPIKYCFGSGGDPLLYTAAILLLNRQNPDVYIKDVSASRGMAGGKSVVFRAHSTVSIHLSAKGSVKRLLIGDRASPRAHEVRGHWVHYDKQLCEHEWEPLDTSGKRFKCSRCEMRRTWREVHVRGDASRGVIVKHYEVHE